VLWRTATFKFIFLPYILDQYHPNGHAALQFGVVQGHISLPTELDYRGVATGGVYGVYIPSQNQAK